MNNPPGKTLSLPFRTGKPRSYGITAINDVGIGCADLRSHLEDRDDFLDFAKLGIGSAYLDKHLDRKVGIYREFGIPVCFGGTLFEKYYHQGKIDDYVLFLESTGVQWVEVSHGTVNISVEELLEVIHRLKEKFNLAVEVGTKHEGEIPDAEAWIDEIRRLLESGARYVILEGRNTADSGIYHPDGALREELIRRIAAEVDSRRLIFEAPTLNSQIQLINLLGANVNLGNVTIHDLLLLECQRQALRNDTFFSTSGEDN